MSRITEQFHNIEHYVGLGHSRDTMGQAFKHGAEQILGQTRSNILAHPELSIVNWTLFSVSASAAMLFGLLCYQARSKGALVPVVNLFVSIVMMMSYYALATLDNTMIRPAMFAEMGLNLPVMYIQAMILAGASFQQYFSFISLLLVVVLNVLHAVSLYVFSIVELPFAWVWFGFGAVFWLGIATTMTLPVLRSASKQNNRVYSMFVISLVGLLMAQVLYPTLLAFFKTARLDMFKYLIGLGLLDFMTRIGLGVYYCLNGDAFGEVQIYVTKSLKAD